MQLTEVTFGEQPPVDAYGPGFFRVMDEPRTGPLLLSASGISNWSGFDDAESPRYVSRVCRHRLPAALRIALEEAGIGAEVMSSPSACRTYNILLSEGRRVGLAALPV